MDARTAASRRKVGLAIAGGSELLDEALFVFKPKGNVPAKATSTQ